MKGKLTRLLSREFLVCYETLKCINGPSFGYSASRSKTLSLQSIYVGGYKWHLHSFEQINIVLYKTRKFILIRSKYGVSQQNGFLLFVKL
jgi:hypothetical protein